MRPLTEKEREILLLLVKDFTTEYNARSLSAKVNLSPRGALKALKILEQRGLVKSRRLGNALICTPLFGEHGRRLCALLLFEEAQEKAARWVKEFEGFTKACALVLFGSVLRTKDHNDIDLMIVVEEKYYKSVVKLVDEKNKILLKHIHPVWQTPDDFGKNLRKPDKVVLDVMRTGIVLKGQETIVEALARVTSR